MKKQAFYKYKLNYPINFNELIYLYNFNRTDCELSVLMHYIKIKKLFNQYLCITIF